MKRSLTKREILLVIVTTISLLLIIVAGMYIINLQRLQADKDRAQAATITTRDNAMNEQINYTDTICGEYRKLYAAYKEIYKQASSTGITGYSQPGSAKGQIDECYRLP